MAYDNPARRLHILLHKAFDFEDPSKAQKGIQSRQIWAGVFAVDSNNKTELLIYAEEFLALLKSTREAVKRFHSVNHASYVRALDHISSAVYSHGFLGSQWNVLGATLKNPAIMDILEITANTIDRETRLFEITQEQLDELLDSVKTLLDDVLRSDLDDDIKTFLIVRLEEICSAIHHYTVCGSEGLCHVVEANIGAVLLKSIGLTPEQKAHPAWKKFFDLMMKFGVLLGLIADADGFLLPRAGDLIKHLLPGE
ncbi:MAG: hypothetical protein AAF152_00345 [Cyanobacteria bacterium P01_A01_bin.114]